MFIIWFLLILLVLVLVHELGHFAMAKLFKVKVEEFGIFMPPRLFGFRRGETIYSMNALPLGGFVRLSGEVDPSEKPKSDGKEARVWGKKTDTSKSKTGTLASKSIPVRLLTLGAGSLMNLLLPILLLMIALMIPHLTAASTGNVYVDTVAKGSPAAAAGIKSSDVVLELNGITLTSSKQYSRIIAANLGKKLPIVIKHPDGTQTTSTITPSADSAATIGATITTASPDGGVLVDNVTSGYPAQVAGIVAGDRITAIGETAVTSVEQYSLLTTQNVYTDTAFTVVHANGNTATVTIEPYLYPGPTGVSIGTVTKESTSFWKSIPQSFVEYWNILLEFKNGITATIQGTVPFQVSGPVGIAEATGQVAKLGIAALLRFAAFISINLGIMNILPLPALDGGRVFFVLLEWVRRGKRVSPKTENLIHTIGFLAFMALAVLVTWGDISRLIRG